MKTVYREIRLALRWFASLVEDKTGSFSHKRALALWAMWILDRTYRHPEKYDQTLIWPLIVLIAAAAAITLPEWFSKLKNTKNEAAE